MKKFSEWIQIKEATGKVRSAAADLQNLRIGKLSPYSTFGHSNEPGIPLTVAGNLVQAMGDRMRKETGPVDAASTILKLDLFTKDQMVQDNMVLQMPFGPDNVPEGWNPISISNRRHTFFKVSQIIPEPERDPRVVQVGELNNSNFENKFQPYYEGLETENKDIVGNYKMSLYNIALEFTTALSKIKIYNQLRLKDKDKKMQNIYDIENPTIEKQMNLEKNGYFILINVFKYNKKKTASGDYNWQREEEEM